MMMMMMMMMMRMAEESLPISLQHFPHSYMVHLLYKKTKKTLSHSPVRLLSLVAFYSGGLANGIIMGAWCCAWWCCWCCLLFLGLFQELLSLRDDMLQLRDRLAVLKARMIQEETQE